MKVLILHAYSRHNSGDAWLVAWTVGLVREALGPQTKVTVLAVDPESFSEWNEFALKDVNWIGLRSVLHRRVWQETDLIVAVGGGYLRAQGVRGSAKMIVAHLSQLVRASQASVPSVYMPQSIGPFPFLLRRLVGRKLSKLSTVHVRDDRSREEFNHVDTLVRSPDLALIELAGAPRKHVPLASSRDPLWIVRSLPSFAATRYVELMGDAKTAVAIQSEGRGNDDRAFCSKELGLRDLPLLSDVLRTAPPRVVVSVRLHGALLSVLSGWPAVHLSYERKGFGAFGDLGLEDFVESVYSSTRKSVAAKVERIYADPGEYWSRVDGALPALAAARADLLGSLCMNATHRPLK